MTARLNELAAVFTGALETWDARDPAVRRVEDREAANTAVDAADAMLRLLFAERRRLSAEVRVFDDAVLADTDALLAELAERRDGDR